MLVQTKRFTIAEYHRLDEIGLLQQGDREARTELIRGEIVYMVAKGDSAYILLSQFIR